jgi:hypothetical protein
MANAGNKGLSLRAALAVLWRTFLRDLSDSYRPELHYMRGPGPKWRAKHAVAQQPTGARPQAIVSLARNSTRRISQEPPAAATRTKQHSPSRRYSDMAPVGFSNLRAATWRYEIRKFIKAIALTGVMASPVFAKPAMKYYNTAPYAEAPATFARAPVRDFQGPDYVGRDPDPSIRLELHRDPATDR